jgi:hypothetical protein
MKYKKKDITTVIVGGSSIPMCMFLAWAFLIPHSGNSKSRCKRHISIRIDGLAGDSAWRSTEPIYQAFGVPFQ